MTEEVENLRGSDSRDEFKRRHKQLSRQFYASDLDFVLVEKHPYPDIVAALDYKRNSDSISFAEVIAYNSLLKRGIPLFIIKGDELKGRFTICEYMGGHHGRPDCVLKAIRNTDSWVEFEAWESELRTKWTTRWGPSANGIIRPRWERPPPTPLELSLESNPNVFPHKEFSQS